jgi:RNA polymerase sigma-70 factor (ECF subfamily)
VARAVGQEPGAEADPLRGLARAAAGGDLASMRRLLEAVAPRVLRIARSVLGAGEADVEDVVQESLIALVRALPAYRGEASAMTYASRIAVRTAVAARHRLRSHRARQTALGADAVERDAVAPSAAALAAGERRRTVLRELLAGLPDAQAESLALRFVLGASLEEVAEATGAPLNTVRSRLRLAKEALARRLEAEPELCALLGEEEP